MISMPISPYLVFPFAAGIAIAAGLVAGKLMEFVLKVFGHTGYVAETYEQKATRQYMEKAKQGMRD
jgi:hypothetical protein